MWYKVAKREITEHLFAKSVRDAVRDSSYLRGMFESYGVPLTDLAHLRVKVSGMGSKATRVDGNTICLNVGLFRGGDDDLMPYVVPAVAEWLSGRKTIFSHNEETPDQYVHAIAYEIDRKTDPELIAHRILPVIKAHVRNQAEADLVYVQSLAKAKRLFRK